MKTPNKNQEIKIFICPYCGNPIKIKSNQEIIDHITMSKTCTNQINWDKYTDEEIIKRLIRNGLLTSSECFLS